MRSRKSFFFPFLLVIFIQNLTLTTQEWVALFPNKIEEQVGNYWAWKVKNSILNPKFTGS